MRVPAGASISTLMPSWTLLWCAYTKHFVDEICSSFCARSYCSDLVVAGDGHLAPFVVADILLPERILRV